MKILISSKKLATGLKDIDFSSEAVFQVRGESSKIIISTEKQSVEIDCDILQFNPRIRQVGRRWDWVRNLVNSVEEQPLTLEIKESVVNVIFQY